MKRKVVNQAEHNTFDELLGSLRSLQSHTMIIETSFYIN